MAARIIFTVVALFLALQAFLGAGPTPGGPTNLFGILFLFVAIISWFDWETIREGFRDRVNFTLIRIAPLMGTRPDRRKRD